MRHAGFHIDREAHGAWIGAMRKAIDGVEIDAAHKETLWGYLEMAAAGLVNQAD
jgi:hemoglobin